MKAGDQLSERIFELMNNPPNHDKNGRTRNKKTIDYSEAFNIACDEAPELAQAYRIEIDGGE